MKSSPNKQPRCMDEILTRDLISSLSKGRLNREQTQSMLESLYKTAFEDGAKTAERVTTEYLVLHFCQTLHYVIHHQGTEGVHGKNGRDLDLHLKWLGQMAFEREYPELDFVKEFGRNYL